MDTIATVTLQFKTGIIQYAVLSGFPPCSRQLWLEMNATWLISVDSSMFVFARCL